MNLRQYADHLKTILRWVPTTEEKFDYGLGVLPPLGWNSLGFLVGEASDHRPCTISGRTSATFSAFARIAGQHYAASQALTLAEWKALTPADVLENIGEAVPS